MSPTKVIPEVLRQAIFDNLTMDPDEQSRTTSTQAGLARGHNGGKGGASARTPHRGRAGRKIWSWSVVIHQKVRAAADTGEPQNQSD